MIKQTFQEKLKNLRAEQKALETVRIILRQLNDMNENDRMTECDNEIVNDIANNTKFLFHLLTEWYLKI